MTIWLGIRKYFELFIVILAIQKLEYDVALMEMLHLYK